MPQWLECLVKMAEKPMDMKDTDDVQDTQEGKPMGPGPDLDDEIKDAKEQDKSEKSESEGSKLWMWIATFVLGALIGFVLGVWLV